MCKIEGCETNSYVGGLCCTHYRQSRYDIDEADRKKRRMTAVQRVAANSSASELWTKSMRARG